MDCVKKFLTFALIIASGMIANARKCSGNIRMNKFLQQLEGQDQELLKKLNCSGSNYKKTENKEPGVDCYLRLDCDAIEEPPNGIETVQCSKKCRGSMCLAKYKSKPFMYPLEIRYKLNNEYDSTFVKFPVACKCEKKRG